MSVPNVIFWVYHMTFSGFVIYSWNYCIMFHCSGIKNEIRCGTLFFPLDEEREIIQSSGDISYTSVLGAGISYIMILWDCMSSRISNTLYPAN